MSRPFSAVEARGLLKKYKELLRKLDEAAIVEENNILQVKNAAESVAEQETYNLLRSIPIEELNREKKGYRVKLLRDYGYETLADFLYAPKSSVMAIGGIGSNSVHSMLETANEIAEITRQSVKIKLSSDDKTPESSALLTAILQYQRFHAVADECRKLLTEYRSTAEEAMESLKPASWAIKWLFASKVKKQKAIESYGVLNELINSDFGLKAEACTEDLDNTGYINITRDEAWESFASNPVRFFNDLEKIDPGVLGNDDSVYGLPEDIAAAIQEEEFLSEGLLCELRRYQEWGVKYALHQRRILLGDEMGLGKTVQAIAVMVSLRNAGATHFVVVCPASVLENWCREVRKMSTLNVTKVHGARRTEALYEWMKIGGVAVTTYETTSHFLLPEDFTFKIMVVDEAHYIKNPAAKRTRNVMRLGGHAERLMFMTGTALENNVDEMITLIGMLKPSVAERVKNMKFMASAPQFREAISSVYYRRKREDVLTELPELTESEEWCEMTPNEEIAYENAVLSRNFSKARRVSWNADRIQDSSKATRLSELVEEAAAEGRKVIVYSFFLETIRRVSTMLGEKCMEPIYGAVAPQRRQEIIDEFDKAPAGSVLVAQIQSGGTGLNIQSASVVIMCEPQFKPSIENQAISRAYRMGQTRNVLVYRLLCENTVDERIMNILNRKQRIFDAFADESVAAMAEKEGAVNEKMFGDVMDEEYRRISAKRRGTKQSNSEFQSGITQLQ